MQQADDTYADVDWKSFAMCYPVLDSRIDLHRSATGGTLVYCVREEESGKGATVSGYQILETEGYMIEFLSRCDGMTPVAEISAAMADAINPAFGPALTIQALEGAYRAGLISLSAEKAPRQAIRLTGSERSFQPQHLTMEIIETCNFSCDHCYYSSSPFKKGILAVEEAIRIMDRAYENGVRVIELTGGECTIHPGFRDILDHACRTFDLTAIITNGYRVGNDESLAAFIGERENVLVQVSVDGLAEHHDAFRKHKKSFEACERAVRRLSGMGCKVRVAMTVTDQNVADIDPLFRNAREWGAMQVVFSPVASIGRGCNVTEGGAAATTHLAADIQKELAPYAGDPVLGVASAVPTSAKFEEAVNCGAGWRTFAVDYDGVVRACNYSRDSKKFGNILSDDYEAIFSQKANYLFNNAPSPGGEECQDCAYYFNCKGCFVKAFMVSETEYPQCPWRLKWFPDMDLAQDENILSVASIDEVAASLPTGSKRQLSACSGCGSVGKHLSSELTD